MPLDKKAYSYESLALELDINPKIIRDAVRDNLLVATYLTPRNPRLRNTDVDAWLDSLPTERTK